MTGFDTFVRQGIIGLLNKNNIKFNITNEVIRFITNDRYVVECIESYDIIITKE